MSFPTSRKEEEENSDLAETENEKGTTKRSLLVMSFGEMINVAAKEEVLER